VFRKANKNIPHTCTSRSSCMTSFFLAPVFGSTTSCGTSESLLSYPKLHIQDIELGSWGSLKAFGEVAIPLEQSREPSDEPCLSLQNFQKLRDRIRKKKKSKRCKVKNHSTFQPSKQGGKPQAPQVK
jgi:hypothetical protein